MTVLIGYDHIAPAKFEKNAFVFSESRRIWDEQFFPVFGDFKRTRGFFRELRKKIFELRSHHVVCEVCEFYSKEFCVLFACCPRSLRIERVDAPVGGFVIDRNVPVLGKATSPSVQLRERMDNINALFRT